MAKRVIQKYQKIKLNDSLCLVLLRFEYIKEKILVVGIRCFWFLVCSTFPIEKNVLYECPTLGIKPENLVCNSQDNGRFFSRLSFLNYPFLNHQEIYI